MLSTDQSKCGCSICSGKFSLGDLIADMITTIEAGEYGLITTGDLTYTYGRHQLGLHELATITPDLRQARSVLLSANGIDSPGQYDSVAATPASAQRLTFARYLAGEDIAVLQILWPDHEGRWPWDSRYSGSSQPALGGNDVHLEDPRG